MASSDKTRLDFNVWQGVPYVIESTTYFYVATAVDASSDESGYSNQVSVTTPSTFQTNPSAPSGLGGKSQ